MKLLVIRLFLLTSVTIAFCEHSIGQKDQKSEPKRFAISYIKATVFDNPELSRDLEIKDVGDWRYIQLKPSATFGVAKDYFYEPSGRYNITVFYTDTPREKATAQLLINDNVIGSIAFGGKPDSTGRYIIKHKTFSGIDIAQWSKITLQFFGNGTSNCRVQKVVFSPAATAPEKLQPLNRPVTLSVFQDAAERSWGRAMLSDFVNGQIDSIMENRVVTLRQMKSTKEWAAQQNKTRGELEKFFGRFPKRTPLHTKITGKIEHEKYTVEKLYFESQPCYYVTANLYLPKNIQGPSPAVLFTSGHSGPGKALPLYQEACIGLALKGYVVLAIDPMGQGERLEYFDSKSEGSNIESAVNQHYYLGRPAFLINRTFSGLRVWDCIRALDFLVSRPEVDTTKIAAVGNSGGGQMGLLITAVDKRVKVCAVGHPGGQMEKNYLLGQNLIDRQILSLIAPRPVLMIVGEKSGEAVFHQKKVEDIQMFDEGLGYSKERAQLVLVDGVHDLKYPKREKVYEWLNHWFDKEAEGTAEPRMQTENPKDLWATKSGSTLVSLKGQTGQSLNAKILKTIYKPAKDLTELKKQVAARIGLNANEKNTGLDVRSIETIHYGDISVEKFTYQSETGIVIPSLLIKPRVINPAAPVYIYASDRGKPRSYQDSIIPFALAKKGSVVLAIDVRGVGEVSPTPALPQAVVYSTCSQFQWYHDCLAIQSPGFGRTMLAMRTFDIMRGIDFLQSRKELQGRKLLIYGEGIGGLWALLASIYDQRVDGVTTRGTLVSYKELVNKKYYAINSAYFWVPGALCDFDISDLARLASPKLQVWMDPINGLGQKLSVTEASSIIGSNKNMRIISSNK